MSDKTLHGLTSVLTFGKYKGLTVAAVIKFNAAYFLWAVKNVPWFDMDAEARKVGQRAISADREQRVERQNAWAWGFGAGAKRAAQYNISRRIQIEMNERRKAEGASEALRDAAGGATNHDR